MGSWDFSWTKKPLGELVFFSQNPLRRGLKMLYLLLGISNILSNLVQNIFYFSLNLRYMCANFEPNRSKAKETEEQTLGWTAENTNYLPILNNCNTMHAVFSAVVMSMRFKTKRIFLLILKHNLLLYTNSLLLYNPWCVPNFFLKIKFLNNVLVSSFLPFIAKAILVINNY